MAHCTLKSFILQLAINLKIKCNRNNWTSFCKSLNRFFLIFASLLLFNTSQLTNLTSRDRIIANAILRDVTCWPPGGATVHAPDRKTDFICWADRLLTSPVDRGSLSECLDGVNCFLHEDKSMAANTDKTELWCAISRHEYRMSVFHLWAGKFSVNCSFGVRSLEIFLDAISLCAAHTSRNRLPLVSSLFHRLHRSRRFIPK
jgi:hypothetical protein